MPVIATSAVISAPVDRVWDIIRDFNGHDSWHPLVDKSRIEGAGRADKVGCVRNFNLADGSNLRERLLSLSDAETMFRYCLIETPVPLFNYIAEVRLVPVTMTDSCFIHWSGRFQTPKGEEATLSDLVRNSVQRDGILAIEKEVISDAD